MKYFVILLFLSMLVGFAYAYEPEPVGIEVIEYGIFDKDGSVVHQLRTDQPYQINVHFESELDVPVSFTYHVQILDKNKHWTEPVEEFNSSGFLQPNEKKTISFEWIPKYDGKFRTLVGFGNNEDDTVIGSVPQYDFEVASEIKPPSQQVQSGIPFDEIQCKENLVLIQKYDGSPACVKPETKEKLVERGWTSKDDSVLSKTNANCMTIEQSKQIASFFKTPTYLPEDYSHVCSRSGMPFESYIVYYNQEFPTNWQIHELVSDGAIFIYQIDERNLIGEKKFQTYGSADQRIQETYDSVMKGNPSLNPQLITINGMLAYAVDSCPDCGMQTANFSDGTMIQESTSTKTRIKFIDENGVKYMLETTLPLQELIKVAESLQ